VSVFLSGDAREIQPGKSWTNVNAVAGPSSPILRGAGVRLIEAVSDKDSPSAGEEPYLGAPVPFLGLSSLRQISNIA